MSKYTINVSFQTRVNKTTRTLEIAESFGLGLDEKEWTLYDNLELEVKQGDVVYITGQSGSGKSVVLRELQRQMKDEGLSVASIDDFTFDNEVISVSCAGRPLWFGELGQWPDHYALRDRKRCGVYEWRLYQRRHHYQCQSRRSPVD